MKTDQSVKKNIEYIIIHLFVCYSLRGTYTDSRDIDIIIIIYCNHFINLF